MEWDKVPSVTVGGKTFFYTATVPSGQRLWIVWNRLRNSYVLRIENDKEIPVKSAFEGKRLAEKLYLKES